MERKTYVTKPIIKTKVKIIPIVKKIFRHLFILNLYPLISSKIHIIMEIERTKPINIKC